MPLVRGLGRLPKYLFILFSDGKYWQPSGKGDRKGRPYRIAWPQCVPCSVWFQTNDMGRRLCFRAVLLVGAATKRTPHDESCGLFPHLHPCVPCSVCSTTGAMGHSMYSALMVFILMKISKTNSQCAECSASNVKYFNYEK